MSEHAKTTEPFFQPAPPSAKKHPNYLSEAGAQVLADWIRRYWLQQGCEVAVEVVHQGHHWTVQSTVGPRGMPQ